MSRASKALRESILSRRVGYTPREELNTGNGKNGTPTKKVIRVNCKTTLMLFVERQYGKPIEEIIWEDSIRHNARKLNVTESTISYWRKKFPLNEYTRGKNNRKCAVPESD